MNILELVGFCLLLAVGIVAILVASGLVKIGFSCRKVADESDRDGR